jgi:hypothetical protein
MDGEMMMMRKEEEITFFSYDEDGLEWTRRIGIAHE